MVTNLHTNQVFKYSSIRVIKYSSNFKYSSIQVSKFISLQVYNFRVWFLLTNNVKARDPVGSKNVENHITSSIND